MCERIKDETCTLIQILSSYFASLTLKGGPADNSRLPLTWHVVKHEGVQNRECLELEVQVAASNEQSPSASRTLAVSVWSGASAKLTSRYKCWLDERLADSAPIKDASAFRLTTAQACR